MTPTETYRRVASYARDQLTETAQAAGPPTPAGIIALLALSVPCMALVITGDPLVLCLGLACSALGFLAGVALGAEGVSNGRR